MCAGQPNGLTFITRRISAWGENGLPTLCGYAGHAIKKLMLASSGNQDIPRQHFTALPSK